MIFHTVGNITVIIMLKTIKNSVIHVIIALSITAPVIFLLSLLFRWIPGLASIDGNTKNYILGFAFLGVLFILLGENYLQKNKSYSAAKTILSGIILFSLSLLLTFTVYYIIAMGTYKLICIVFQPTLFIMFPTANFISVWFTVGLIFTVLIYIVAMCKFGITFGNKNQKTSL